MHETRICPLSNKYIKTQANKEKQAVLSLGLGGRDTALVLPVSENQRDTQGL